MASKQEHTTPKKESKEEDTSSPQKEPESPSRESSKAAELVIKIPIKKTKVHRKLNSSYHRSKLNQIYQNRLTKKRSLSRVP
jgi:hypothetical protein